MRRRLLAMDTTLSKVDVVLDSLSEVANTYGPRPGTLHPVSRRQRPVRRSVVVRDRRARSCRPLRARALGVARAGSVSVFVGGQLRLAGARIRRGGSCIACPPSRRRRRSRRRLACRTSPPEPDSAFIVAVDIDTRHIDTLASMRIPKQVNTIKVSPEGMFIVLLADQSDAD